MSAAPRSSLFVSCDLVGSTQFKQKNDGWQKVFLSFYREFPQFVANASRARSDDGDAARFQLWKAVGDELIFEVEVRSEKEIGLAVRVWLDAMKQYERQVLEASGLALKGGAFIATFPGPDSESTIPRYPDVETSDNPVAVLNQKALSGTRAHKKYLYDYFGPSIDTGFRVFGLASQRYFTLSVEVAWAVAAAAYDASGVMAGSDTHHVNDIVLHGRPVLKGVWAGREYPVFAIDRDQADAVNVALARLDGAGLEPKQIIDVCHACHESATWPSRLFLPDSTNQAFKVEPEDAMKPLFESESSRVGSEEVDNGPQTGEVDALAPEVPLG